MLATATATVAARREPREVLLWSAVALAFCYFSIDEAATLHEQFNMLLHYAVGTPRGIDVLSLTLVAIVGAAMLPFVLRLDRPTRGAMFLSAVLLVTGGAGIEIVTNKVLGLSGEQIRAALVITPLEELLEMLAAFVVIRALLRRLAASGPSLALHFVDTEVVAGSERAAALQTDPSATAR
ncbi:hypothetical protein [Methylibium sp.]|uniref:hypothetical protein n=1 Tax=Methylibium sp. TaxID=2067992 RepID=UPI00182AC5D6|nr:hypothetical protein [Methylibium sp.]MBA3589552.1 hypothetical protein [Methylibium sp.]